MNIGLYLLETKFPNFAAMKVAAYHKSLGDTVGLYLPLFHGTYDKIYAFSVFTYTPKTGVTSDMITGGTGFDSTTRLPDAIEHTQPDYSLYPDFAHALGFLTRGCPNRCPWCFVPEKEGDVYGYRTIDEILSCKHKSAVLMDNNVLACDFGITQIERIRELRVAVDFNQGLDARLIDVQVASLLARVRWIRYIRLACDSQSQKAPLERAAARLRAAGYSSAIMAYVLIREDVEEALERIEFLRSLNITPFAQPYRDKHNTPPTHLQKHMARWVNRKVIWHSCTFDEYLRQTAPAERLVRTASPFSLDLGPNDHA